ncbi:MAG: flippase-like domain-containing protein [Acidobacteriia bacterium]|nr:flippase-like domain-containing protein [Terriglobia bacterium]
MNTKRVLTSAVVIVVLAVLVYFQIQHWRTFDWARFRAETSGIGKLHIFFAIALIYSTYYLRAVRWRVFLKPICNAPVSRLIAPTFIGFTGLALLGRPGEFVRPYLISKKENVSLSSQIGVWTVERIFDVGAFAVLMAINVFVPSSIQSNPYIPRFREAALLLLSLVAAVSGLCYLIRTQGPRVAAFLHRTVSPFSRKLAEHLEEKTRAFGIGLNTIQDRLSFLQLTALSLAIWFIIALAYREVAHAYPPEPGWRQAKITGQKPEPRSVDAETAKMADNPLFAGQPLDDTTLADLRSALEPKGFRIERHDRPHDHGLWLYKGNHLVKRIGDRPHLADLDVGHTLLLMGFSMVGSVVQLPAVGGGSQLAVISALQVIYGIPPELAVSCGILLWLVTFMAVIPVGLVLAHREHLSLRKISHEAHDQKALEHRAPGFGLQAPGETRKL